MDQEGQAVFGVWEVGVDLCEHCDRVATEAAAATKPRVRMVPLCPEHADLAQWVTGARMKPGGATCGYQLGHDVVCGATTTHVQLIVYYEGEKPELGFVALCRRHATEN